jgi:hypothetical protein
MTNPVVQVVNEKTGEVEYTLRIKGDSFKPFVFATGKYTVRVGELGAGRVRVSKGLEISENAEVEIRLTAN